MKGPGPGPGRAPRERGPNHAKPRLQQCLCARAPSARSQRIFYRVYIARTGRQCAVFSKAYIAPKNIIYLCGRNQTWNFPTRITTNVSAAFCALLRRRVIMRR